MERPALERRSYKLIGFGLILVAIAAGLNAVQQPTPFRIVLGVAAAIVAMVFASRARPAARG